MYSVGIKVVQKVDFEKKNLVSVIQFVILVISLLTLKDPPEVTRMKKWKTETRFFSYSQWHFFS